MMRPQHDERAVTMSEVKKMLGGRIESPYRAPQKTYQTEVYLE